jgi:hypothetical protein
MPTYSSAKNQSTVFHLCVESSSFLSAKGVLPVPCKVGAGSGGEDLPQSGSRFLHVGQNLQEPSTQGYGSAITLLPVPCEVGAVEARTCLRVGVASSTWDRTSKILVNRDIRSAITLPVPCEVGAVEARTCLRVGPWEGSPHLGQNLQQPSKQG